MKRQLINQSFFIILVLVCFVFGSNAYGASPTDLPRNLEKDYKTALRQTQESETEFWDVQLQALSSEEARNVQGQYRLIDGYQWEETQFVAVKAMEEYLKKINAQMQMKKFFPEVHSKLEQVTKIWIEARSGLRPKGVDADMLPGDLRNQYPVVVSEATTQKSLRFKTIILDVSKKLSANKVFRPQDFQVHFEFYFNHAAIQSILESKALTPLEQKSGRLAIQDEKLAQVVLKKYSTNSAKEFNKKVGARYLRSHPNFRKFQESQLMLYKSYLQKS
jgi:hypothetical protein